MKIQFKKYLDSEEEHHAQSFYTLRNTLET